MASPSAKNKNAAPGRPVLSIAILVAILAFGVDNMFVQLERNGYMEAVMPLIWSDKPAMLPGTTRPILRQYTGIAVLDQLFATANIFWANMVDGTRPECSLYLLQFGGQLPAVLTLLLVESRRVGGPNALLRSVIGWGVAMQMFGFGVVMPLYAILHLALPRRAPGSSTKAVQLQDPIQLHTVAPAFMLGYIFPSALLIFPYSDPASRQRSNVVWQYFPVYVGALITGFTAMAKRISIGQNLHKSPSQLSRDALSHAYGFALAFAAIFQWATYAVLFVAWAFPDELPSGLADRFTPKNVFVPNPPHSFRKMESPAAAMHEFVLFDQYTGSAAILVWAAALCQEAGVTMTSVVDILRDSLILGPIAAGLKILRKRDNALLSKAQ